MINIIKGKIRPRILNQNISYSVWEYILKLFSILLMALITFSLLGNKTNALNSFVWSSFAFLIITVYSSMILLKSRKWVWFFVLAFLIKLFIGLIHYLYFIDPNYFQINRGYLAPTYEYESVFNQIISSAHDKLHYGIFYYNFLAPAGIHSEIISFISIPFMFFGDYILTISPLNSFFSLLISINIILVSKYKLHVGNKSLKYIAIVTTYFPMTLISSLLFRDIIGLGFMSIGINLILFSKKNITQYLMLIIACFFFYLQRTVYPVLLMIAFIINTTIYQKSRSTKKNIIYKSVSLIIVIILIIFTVGLVNDGPNEAMANGAFQFSLLALPLKPILGMIGPFPWTQFLLYKKIPANAYQLQDYLQGVFNITVFVCIILYWKEYFRKGRINLLTIIGLLLIFVGIFNPFMHMTYVAIGFMFLMPWLLTQISFKKFIRIYLYFFLVLIVINIFFILFLGHLGISSFVL